ncbi:hypothetical protein BT96DRAFT_940825 [Gymnopus androsaceus JB14]|uniref:F-box domain-containing protein n=1 Tax=Gymnopus androsaceus JB14 TaxID=1447944 RepID=A0A6A4HHP6_9AGAR|nr:hypothetical protein BT96DRAFT_940825 [Gymnopus androsaceus JB14]
MYSSLAETCGFSWIPDWEPNCNPVVHLPEMREMRVIFITNDDNGASVQTFFQKFFSSFLCPSLEGFSASLNGANANYINDVFFSSLSSLQTVEKLSLNMPMTPNSLLECLSLVPNLRFLEIGDREVELYDNEESPAGEHFTQGPGITIDALLTFLESRVQMKMLQSCDVFFSTPRAELTEEEMRRLEALINSGLKLRIRPSLAIEGVVKFVIRVADIHNYFGHGRTVRDGDHSIEAGVNLSRVWHKSSSKCDTPAASADLPNI